MGMSSLVSFPPRPLTNKALRVHIKGNIPDSLLQMRSRWTQLCFTHLFFFSMVHPSCKNGCLHFYTILLNMCMFFTWDEPWKFISFFWYRVTQIERNKHRYKYTIKTLGFHFQKLNKLCNKSLYSYSHLVSMNWVFPILIPRCSTINCLLLSWWYSFVSNCVKSLGTNCVRR